MWKPLVTQRGDHVSCRQTLAWTTKWFLGHSSRSPFFELPYFRKQPSREDTVIGNNTGNSPPTCKSFGCFDRFGCQRRVVAFRVGVLSLLGEDQGTEPDSSWLIGTTHDTAEPQCDRYPRGGQPRLQAETARERGKRRQTSCWIRTALATFLRSSSDVIMARIGDVIPGSARSSLYPPLGHAAAAADTHGHGPFPRHCIDHFEPVDRCIELTMCTSEHCDLLLRFRRPTRTVILPETHRYDDQYKR